MRGPPHVAMRVLVAPVIISSTLVLFGTGVALLALGQTSGTIVGLHKASFLLWLGAAGLTLASATLQAADRLQDRASAQVGFDAD